MKGKLIFEIECGDTTCAFEKGKFCRFFKVDIIGRPSCFNFGILSEKNGWAERHEECRRMTTANSF